MAVGRRLQLLTMWPLLLVGFPWSNDLRDRGRWREREEERKTEQDISHGVFHNPVLKRSYQSLLPHSADHIGQAWRDIGEEYEKV